jgi:hypothetical protein
MYNKQGLLQTWNPRIYYAFAHENSASLMVDVLLTVQELGIKKYKCGENQWYA